MKIPIFVNINKERNLVKFMKEGNQLNSRERLVRLTFGITHND